MKKTKIDFNSHAASIISQAEQPITTKPGRGKVTTFELAPDLNTPLERATFWGGLEETKRNVINTALRYYFENNPEAKAKVSKAAPGEK